MNRQRRTVSLLRSGPPFNGPKRCKSTSIFYLFLYLTGNSCKCTSFSQWKGPIEPIEVKACTFSFAEIQLQSGLLKNSCRIAAIFSKGSWMHSAEGAWETERKFTCYSEMVSSRRHHGRLSAKGISPIIMLGA